MPEPVSPADTPPEWSSWAPGKGSYLLRAREFLDDDRQAANAPKARSLLDLVCDLAAALLAVGERDKAKIEQMHAHIAGLTDALELLRDSDSWERDRRQIARLTEALTKARGFVYSAVLDATKGRAARRPESVERISYERTLAQVDAVLAGEEDAAPEVVKDNAPTGGLDSWDF